MSIATLDRPALATTTRARRAARKPATLSLMVDGVPYDVRCFEIDDSRCGDGLSVTGMEHSLRGPSGPRFQVYGLAFNASHCQRCDRDGCAHILALADVGLL
jgi:hypothetical protein